MEHREDPAVVGVVGFEAELGEDVADVLFDGAGADDEVLGDGEFERPSAMSDSTSAPRA